MRKITLLFAGLALALMGGVAVAQTPASGGAGTGTSTYAGPAQKAGAANQNAGSESAAPAAGQRGTATGGNAGGASDRQ